MDVGDEADAQALVESAEAPVGERPRDLLLEDDADGLAVEAEDVDAAVEVVAAVVRVVAAAHLAERGDDLVPRALRVERPREVGGGELLAEQARQNVRGRGKGSGRPARGGGLGRRVRRFLVNRGGVGREHAADEVVGGVGDVERAVAREGDGRRLVEAGLGARAVGEAAPAPRHDAGRVVGRDLQDASALELGDVEEAVVRDGKPRGPPQLAGRGAVGRALPDDGERRDLPVLRDAAQAVVARVGDVDVTLLVDGHAAGRVEERGRERLAVGVAGRARAGQRPHLTLLRDDADAVVVGVGDVDVSVFIDRHADRRVELRRAGRAVGVAGRARAGQRRDDALFRNFADAVVARVGDVERAFVVEREGRGRVEAGGRARAVGEALAPAGERRDRALLRDLADAVALARVRDVDVAFAVDGDAERLAEAGAAALGAVLRAGRAVAGEGLDARGPAHGRRARRPLAQEVEEEGRPARDEEQEGDEEQREPEGGRASGCWAQGFMKKVVGRQ